MTLKQLQAFYQAASSPSFLFAAERLHISVSTLSKRISDLEASLECVLFDRSCLRARLTGEGEQLLPHVEQLLKQASVVSEFARPSENLRGSCHFGVGELSALTWLAAFIGRMQKTAPDLMIEPMVEAGSSSGHLERRVAEGGLDFAVVANRPSDERIQSQGLGSADFSWVFAPSIQQKTGNDFHALLSEYALISLPASTGTSRVVEDWLERTGLKARRRLHCNSWAVIAQLLIQGLGIGVLPDYWSEQLIGSGQLVKLRSQTPLAALDYFFISRQRDSRPLIAVCRRIAHEVVSFRPCTALTPPPTPER